MGRRALYLFAVAAVLWLALLPRPVSAATSLASPVPKTRALTGFGETYSSGGVTRVHGGLDLAAPQGATVSAACAGSVTFAGRLPSGEGEVLGVTIATADGLKVTVSPLTSVAVRAGDTVEQGARLGTLSGEGDASSAESHVHLSVRSGETYLDPAKLLQVPPPASDQSPVEQPAPVSQPSAAPVVPRPSAPPAVGASPAAATAPQAVPAAATGLTHGASPVASPSGISAPVAPPTAIASPSGVTGTSAESAVVAPDAAAQVRAVSASVAGVSKALSARVAGVRMLRHASPPPASSPLRSLRHLSQRLAAFETAAGALLASAAFLWPIWRRSARPSPLIAEPVPSEVRV